jgi:protein ImuB
MRLRHKSSGYSMLWLCLHFPSLSLEVFSRAQSQQEHAIAVTTGNHIHSCNSLAEQHGILPGLSAATAHALCDNLHVFTRQADREKNALQNLANWCYQFTPATSIHKSRDLLLEINGSLKLFNGLAALLNMIQQGISKHGFSCQPGLAHTPKAACLLARTGLHCADSLPAWFDQENPALQKNNLHEQLQRIPLSFLDCSEHKLKALKNMGFTVLGDILGLPEPAIGKRLGKNFLYHLQQLTGKRPDPQKAISPATKFYSELHFVDGISNRQMLLFPMKRLLGELGDFLNQRQLYCRSLDWQYSSAKHHTTLPLNPSIKHHNTASLLELSRLALEELVFQEDIETISLQAEQFAPLELTNQSLFTEDQQDNPDPQAGQLLLDKLGIRLGRQQIYSLTRQNSHIPEQTLLAASCQQPATGEQQANHDRPDSKRPTWLFKKPVPLQYRQRQLYLQQGKLRLLKGPERIDSQWWGKPVQRDYFIARHDNDALYWVFREHNSGHWYAHGLFA